jgi:hypothetical protein
VLLAHDRPSGHEETFDAVIYIVDDRKSCGFPIRRRYLRLTGASGLQRILDNDWRIVNNPLTQRCSYTRAMDDGANMGVRRLLLKGVLLSVVVVYGALFALHKDSNAHADVLINRSPSDVWKVVSNSAAYRSWNPFITRVDGDFREGAIIRITLGTGPDSMVFKPTVLLVRPAQDLCWRGSVWIRGIFDGTHCIHLTPVADGTRLEQIESFSGLLVGRLTEDVIEETQRNFQAMDNAVKQRAEAKAP